MVASQEKAIEQARVDQVINAIDQQIEQVKEAIAEAHRETRAVEKNYGENASINRYEVDDIAESRSALEQQRQLVARATENEDILKRQLATLQELRKSPYFGRIQIQEPESNEIETLYIGVASLMNSDKTDFLVYDWRAPISSVYYNGTLGPVTYQTPSGPRTVELVQKRQFTIENGRITNMFDTNETVGDEMLQTALGQQNDQFMQNIVATIQQEQNDIIRNTSSDLLIVQGVAGSGKTSTVLQRIAYLLYHSKESLNADQIVLFSPNLLFSQYISEVLPSLGERNMRQVTLAGFLKRRFEGLNVETIFDRYEEGTDDQAKPIQKFLESAKAMQAVREYVETIKHGQHSLVFTDINFGDQVFFSADHIQNIFNGQPAALSIADRLVRTKNHLIRELQKRSQIEAKKDWVQKALNELDTQAIHRLMGRHSIDDFADEQAQARYLSRRLAHNRLRIVADAIYNNYFLDPYSQYAQFLKQINWPKEINLNAQTQLIHDYQRGLEFHQLHFMHTAPLMYLRDLITGSGENNDFQYVFIDEMQDYPTAMLIYLHHTFPNARFTILGDSEQALFYPLQLPENLLKTLAQDLQAKKPRLITLRQSYRSTTEITNFAKALLPDGDQIHAFTRHGQSPVLKMCYQQTEWERQLQETVNQQLTKYPTVAILTKDQEQAQQVYHALYRHVNHLHRLTSKDVQLPHEGVVILPTYLAKGLEFDSVVLADVSQKAMGPAATGLLYTMATRAMHNLTLISNGPIADAFTDQATKQLIIHRQLSEEER
ncbi:MAG: RNA polymerase recycling motor HelD [Limosilactobacillus coleohominis]|uniref:RNA polymerase recycling motor HelD n=1 Tax=Limosilactobacillus coleohominis TaxID=181675 RepID=UPI002A7F10DA|nr:RNA polymerase recycling motor HelD [Limosilactobacillus coleohominis]MCI5812566.1 AAA family ATPase [Lactobacillus sp.]MDY3702457.1 RNA polymerase recycling motor HelD [Limosilactobacillus coleohominis]MDY5628502.1 RNA polymerase recycling motor HelD [Limosilactobacillus coleohominis]